MKTKNLGGLFSAVQLAVVFLVACPLVGDGQEWTKVFEFPRHTIANKIAVLNKETIIVQTSNQNHVFLLKNFDTIESPIVGEHFGISGPRDDRSSQIAAHDQEAVIFVKQIGDPPLPGFHPDRRIEPGGVYWTNNGTVWEKTDVPQPAFVSISGAPVRYRGKWYFPATQRVVHGSGKMGWLRERLKYEGRSATNMGEFAVIGSTLWGSGHSNQYGSMLFSSTDGINWKYRYQGSRVFNPILSDGKNLLIHDDILFPEGHALVSLVDSETGSVVKSEIELPGRVLEYLDGKWYIAKPLVGREITIRRSSNLEDWEQLPVPNLGEDREIQDLAICDGNLIALTIGALYRLDEPNRDNNRNGLPDSWEENQFHNSALIRDPSIDTDGDGLSMYQESKLWGSATEPDDGNVRLESVEDEESGQQFFEFRFNQQQGNSEFSMGSDFEIQASNDLANWEDMSDEFEFDRVEDNGDGSETSVFKFIPTLRGLLDGAVTFFRLDVKEEIDEETRCDWLLDSDEVRSNIETIRNRGLLRGIPETRNRRSRMSYELVASVFGYTRFRRTSQGFHHPEAWPFRFPYEMFRHFQGLKLNQPKGSPIEVGDIVFFGDENREAEWKTDEGSEFANRHTVTKARHLRDVSNWGMVAIYEGEGVFATSDLNGNVRSASLNTLFNEGMDLGEATTRTLANQMLLGHVKLKDFQLNIEDYSFVDPKGSSRFRKSPIDRHQWGTFQWPLEEPQGDAQMQLMFGDDWDFFSPRTCGTNRVITSQPLRHSGADYVAREGSLVRAAHSGEVINIFGDGIPVKDEQGDEVVGDGITILGDTTEFATSYIHLDLASDMERGERVKKGQIIGTIRRLPEKNGDHLHFEFHVNPPLGGLTETLQAGRNYGAMENNKILGSLKERCTGKLNILSANGTPTLSWNPTHLLFEERREVWYLVTENQ